MGNQMGYWVDLSSVKLDEVGDTGSTWLQAMPLGTYNHPVHGEVAITPERVQRFAANVKARVRGTDLDIDYDHKAQNGEAAGWVRDADARPDGLWILVEWTKEAFTKVKNKAYRYFSPEFVDVWEHPKSKQKFQDVLFGGGLTNRPFLKDILPINMSEVFDSAHNHAQGGVGMDEIIKALAKLFGLPEDATAEQVLGAAQVKLASTGEGEGNNSNTGDNQSDQNNGNQQGQNSGQGDSQTPQQIAASEALEAVKKLAESNPALKQLTELVEAQQKQFAEQQKQLAETQAALRLSEVHGQVVKLNEFAATKKRSIPPAAADIVKELLLESPKQLSDKVVQLVHKLSETGFVELGERGSARHDAGGETASKKFEELVNNKIKSSNMTYADAVTLVAAENEKLFNEYREESFAFREV